jgi:hypothetical protein
MKEFIENGKHIRFRNKKYTKQRQKRISTLAQFLALYSFKGLKGRTKTGWNGNE